MNILIIPSWYDNKKNPTNGSFFRQQAIALHEAGHNVIVGVVDITLEKLSMEDKKIKIYDDYGIKTYRLNQNKVKKTGNIGTAVAFRRGLLKIYSEIKKSEKIDVIHLHSCLWAGLGAVELSKRSKSPLVITEHSSYYARYKVNPIEKIMIKYVLKNANEVICVSNGLKDILSLYRKDIKVIPNMVDCESFGNINKERDEDMKEFNFLSLCYLNRNKGIDILIQAFAKYFKNSNSKLIIGGDGPERERLEVLSKELEINCKVEFKGALSRKEVVKEMIECDIFILPSRYETFGVVLIEALASSKPIISTKNGGAEDIVTCDNGLIVDVDDIDQLGEAMINLQNNYNKYDKEEIKKMCINKYSKEVVVKKIEKIYNDVIRN